MSSPRQKFEERLSDMTSEHRERCESVFRSLNSRSRLGELALAKGLITHRQLGQALAAQRRLLREGERKRLGDILVRQKVVTVEQLESLLG